jgi:pilus assembly protein CpaF
VSLDPPREAGDAPRIESLRARAVSELRLSGDEVSPQLLRRIVEGLLDADRVVLDDAARDHLAQRVVDEALGLGPLEPLLRDPTITEIMVAGPARLYVERSGRIEPVATAFQDAAHVMHVVDRILAPLGRRVDEASPMVDARLPDGSRVNVVIPPLALDGPVVTIRRFASRPLSGDDLVALGTLTPQALGLLHAAVAARLNILVTGGTGSGKTTTLAAIASAISPTERVVTIEDAAELRLNLPHVVRLESRPPSLEGRGAVTIRALVRNALRMRPDRIVVGEVRGGESLDMLQAMTTGHEGSLSTLHASSPADGVRRLAMLALMGDLELPYRAVSEQVACALDLIVHQARMPDGTRRVTEITGVRAVDGAAELECLAERAGDGPTGVLTLTVAGSELMTQLGGGGR